MALLMQIRSTRHPIFTVIPASEPGSCSGDALVDSCLRGGPVPECLNAHKKAPMNPGLYSLAHFEISPLSLKN